MAKYRKATTVDPRVDELQDEVAQIRDEQRQTAGELVSACGEMREHADALKLAREQLEDHAEAFARQAKHQAEEHARQLETRVIELAHTRTGVSANSTLSAWRSHRKVIGASAAVIATVTGAVVAALWIAAHAVVVIAVLGLLVAIAHRKK